MTLKKKILCLRGYSKEGEIISETILSSSVSIRIMNYVTDDTNDIVYEAYNISGTSDWLIPNGRDDYGNIKYLRITFDKLERDIKKISFESL